jgi:cell division protein FtsW (lipid II flippase)
MMRIVDVDATRALRAWRRPGAARAARTECLGLAAVSVIVLLGLVLAVRGSLESARGRHGGTGTPPVDLRTLPSAAALAPLLTNLDDAATRMAAAQALYRRATADDEPLTHVGALAGVHHASGAAVLSRAGLAALKPHVVVRTPRAFLAAMAQAVVGFFTAFWLAHLVRRWRGVQDDPVLLPVLLLLSGVGMMTMIALRDPLRDTLMAWTFASGVCGGVALLLIASEIDYESSVWRRAVLAPLGVALLLAALLLVFGTGPGTSGVKVNLFGVQPVEAIRLLVVFAIAGALARRFDLLRELSEPGRPRRRWLALVRLPRWHDVRPVVASMGLVLVFFFLQKDLGPALVLSGVVIALYATARGRLAFVFVGLSMLIAGFAAAYALGVPATVGQRVRIWFDPWNNGVPGGSQVAHGLWAMSTGAFLGAGPGRGSPRSIPEGHTDFVLAAIGEELGLVGVMGVIGLYGLLGWRCLRVALRAPGDYSALLGIGVTLALVVQAVVIAGGLLGLLPLTGVVTPFLSYGRSSMLANCVAVGVVLAVARRRGPVRRHLQQPVRVLGGVLATVAILVASRVAWVQVVRADTLAITPSLSEQADGGYRFEYNPRLVAAALALERGTIHDRNGLVLATSRRAEIAALDDAYRAAGVVREESCAPDGVRCYPLGGMAFSVLGDWARQINWGARNSSYLERDSDTQLKGFDDHQRVVDVVHPRTGVQSRTVRRDYRALLPIVRHGVDSTRPDVRMLLERQRDLRSSIDARLQQRVARALADGIARGAHGRGAAVVLDVATGDVLASVSYPWPATGGHAAEADALLDRARYGLYPPGSTFKLLVAAAALRSDPALQSHVHTCRLLPGGRVGNVVRGWSRPVRDDVKDTVPHGEVDLRRGLVASCNAYFAQLAMELGPRPLFDAVSMFQIEAARPATVAALRQTLPHAAYGQADVLASPLKMARVVAAIANGGVAAPVTWIAGTRVASDAAPRFLADADAARLARYMRDAVTSGTGRSVAANATPIAGKTGTAEVDGAPSHSWFVGFAPYGGARPIAFAVLVEHAGYGGRSAAPIAGEIVDAAREIGLFR